MKIKEKFNIYKKNNPDKVFYAGAFLFPLILMFIFAFMRSLAPFGETNLMAIDAWGQYFPMMREAERALFSGNFGYSFSGALGFDLISQSAYYTNSPLWLLAYILPGAVMPWEIDMVVFLRFALAGLSFSYYLSEKTGKKDMSVIVFSLFYAFSGYTVAYINQFMWMDAVILLPLTMLGIERIFEGKKGLLYFISLALTVFSNFYIAFSVCIFSVIWFFTSAIISKCGRKDFLRAALMFFICSLLAGLINLPVLIHVARALSATLASDMGFNGKIEAYNSLKDIFMMLLPFHKSSLDHYKPNIYFGFICLILCFVSLFRKGGFREKMCRTFILLFMVLSFTVNILDYVWHGFHFPNQLPARQSFLFIFVALICAYQGYLYLSETFEARSGKKKAGEIITVLVLVELILNTSFLFLSDIRSTSMDSILRNNEAMTHIHENYTPDKKNNEFWRVERIPPRYNGGQLSGYYGISHYSSTMSADCYNFFLQLGMDVYAKNVSTEYIPDPVLNAMFGIRYIADTEKTDKPLCGYRESAGDMHIYENTAVLPLAYVGDSEIKNVDMSLQGKAFINDIFTKASGTENVIGDDFFNEDEFNRGFEKLNTGSLKIEKIRNSYIEGSVSPAEDGVLIISLPAADVKIYIDGTETPVLTLAGYMAGADISSGEHSIKICF